VTAYDTSGLQITPVIRIDVASPSAASDAAGLQHLATHSRVIVEVSDRPDVADPRILDFITEGARERCLHLEVHGTLEAVTAWMRHLRTAGAPPPGHALPRHLQPVDGGDPA